MLDKLELPQVQEITALERRVLAEHKPPGMAGSLLQNLGRHPLRLALWGVAVGPGARGFIEELDKLFRDGQPLPFAADIAADAELEKVVVEDLRVQDLAGKPERFAYLLTLRQYIEVIEPKDTSLLDTDILSDAQGLMNDIVKGLNIGFDFLTGLERFVSPLSDLLSRTETFNKGVNGA